MLKTLQIKNFKGWKDTGKIELAPLTVFFGSNSSGKSSIGQFLMLLKQSAAYADRKSIFALKSDFFALDLGVPTDIIYEHNTENILSFSYEWDIDKSFVVNDALRERKYSANTVTFEANIGINADLNNTLWLDRFIYKLEECDKSSNKKNVMEIGMQRSDENNRKLSYDLISQEYELRRNTGRAWKINAPVRFYGFPDEAVAYYQNADFIQNLNLLQENFLSSINYLGPLRTKAERLYVWSGEHPESVRHDGYDTISALLSAISQNRRLNFSYKGMRYDFKEVIARALKKMGLIEDYKVERISENRQEYDVKVRTKGSAIFVDIPDVGFGLSQVLPVIVQLFYAPKNSIIIMEQPELHLHPSAQAGLADVMIDAIYSREDGSRNIQLIIETHSEHFLRRLQRRIAEGKFDNDKFSAYFADNNTTPAKLEPLYVDLTGSIVNWPENFFGDIPGDIFAQADAAMRNRLQEMNKK